MVACILLLFQCIHLSLVHCDIDCVGASSCQGDTKICAANIDCNINCQSGESACENMNIDCPANANCVINCQSGYKNICRKLDINAATSTSLTLNCGEGDHACDEITMYCPINGHSGPIQCMLNGATSNAINVQFDIYAVEGFNDFTVSGTEIRDAFIHCGENNYERNCKLQSDPPFECASCLNILSPSQYPTKSPSANPSNFPTINPTTNTDAPSNPTKIPTTYPSLDPTITPTITPTISPSNNPSMNPTSYSIAPSANPSNNPTSSPSDNPTKSPTPSPVLIVGGKDPTGAPSNDIIDETITVFNTKSPNNVDLHGNAGIFSNTSNIIILVLSIAVGVLLCVVAVFMFKKYIEKKQKNEIITIQINSDTNETEQNIQTNAIIAAPATDVQSDSGIGNNVSSFLVGVNEGNDGNDDNDMFITPEKPTPHMIMPKDKVNDKNNDLESDSENEDMYNDDVVNIRVTVGDELDDNSNNKKVNAKNDSYSSDNGQLDQNIVNTLLNKDENSVDNNFNGYDNIQQSDLTPLGDLVAGVE
eukprot:51161_1